MPNGSGFLKTRQSRILTVALFAQAGLFYATSRSEDVPALRPLRELPMEFDSWRLVREGYVDEETQAVLKADDTLTRLYGAGQATATLFVAFFKTQRTGQAPHSPKNCLPGSGWEITSAGRLTLTIPGQRTPIEINSYRVAKGEERTVVLYWYQSRDRVVASEYEAKFWLVADAIRHNRTDTALVRVVVPVRNQGEEAAARAGVDFVRKFFPALKKHLSV